jgi:hypothetical protein
MAAPVKFAKTVAVPGTAEPLFAAPIAARRFWIRAGKAGGPNAGNVFLGDSAVHHTTSRQMLLEPGDYWEPPGHDSKDRDLAAIYVDADAAGDGVVGEYWPVG